MDIWSFDKYIFLAENKDLTFDFFGLKHPNGPVTYSATSNVDNFLILDDSQNSKSHILAPRLMTRNCENS